jgi:D-alanyl-D-alanine dipeptidase
MPLSGVDWVDQFPTSSRVHDLVEPFRTSVGRFLSALNDAGATVAIADTLRPPQRVYLMHWSFCILNGTANPAKIPLMSGVDIQWVHTDPQGNTDPVATKAAAADMVKAYGIVFAPALSSRHSQGLAIDTTISWQDDVTIKNASGTAVQIASSPRNGLNPELHRVGAGYGVIKLVTDPPHWSSDGH